MKKVVIAIVVLLLLCCCCSVIAGVVLFTSPSGYIEVGGKCYHRGAQSNPPATSPCAQAVVDGQTPAPTSPNPAPTNPQPAPSNGSTTQYSGVDSDAYTFTYPKKFFLDESTSLTYVYSQDPKGTVSGGFNDNMNITSADYAIEVTQANCADYGDQLLAEVAASLDIDQTSVVTNIQTINGLKVCVVSWEGVINNIDFNQQQYVFSDAKADKNFIVTVSLKNGSANAGAFADIVDSFMTK